MRSPGPNPIESYLGILLEVSAMESHATEELDPREHGRLLKSLVTPRPIGWISTTGENGVDNLAPFSCYNYAHMSPPVIHFRGSTRDDGTLKDSPRNVIDTGEFVANLVTESVLEDMDATGTGFPSEEDEFSTVGIERAESVAVEPPRVQGSLAQMECEYHDHLRIHDSIVIFGEVVHFHLSPSILENGKVSMESIDTIGRLGGPFYTRSDPLPFERGD